MDGGARDYSHLIIENGTWRENLEKVDEPLVWDCYFCGHRVSNLGLGWRLMAKGGRGHLGWTVICNVCKRPSFLDKSGQPILRAPYGKQVARLNEDVEAIYDEARQVWSVSAYSAVVLLCRKLIMHVAHDLATAAGIEPGKRNFEGYVNLLDELGYIPPNGKAWVDFLRKRGNQENHELIRASESEARRILDFSHYLLAYAYELPSIIE